MSVSIQIKTAMGALFALLVILLFCPAVLAADQDLFDIYPLEIEGMIYNYITGDFNGDDLTDIAVIYSTPTDIDTRYIGLYLQNRANGFGIKSDFLDSLPGSAGQINAADRDEDGRDEIYIIDAEGVSRLDFTPNTGFSRPVRIIRQKTVFIFPYFYGILIDPFLLDINGEPGKEIVIPIDKGYIIYEINEKGDFEILNMLQAPINCQNFEKGIREFSRNNNRGFQINLASIHVADGNLDGRNDLYFLWDRKICCFFQDSTDNFSLSPDVNINFFPAYTNGYIQSHLKDFNGDQRPDVIVSITTGGIANTETKVRCFIADLNGRIESNYRKEITLSDSHCNLFINDFDNDGNPEVVLPAVELGSFATIQMLLMKKADLHLLIYPFRAGLPENEPVKRLQYEFRFDFDDPQPTGEVSIEWSSDYNGDNLHDLVFSDGNGKIKMFFGKNNDYLSKKTDLEISLDRPAKVNPFHLNRGARSDLIVEHKLLGRWDRLTVLKNRNNGY